MKYVKTLVVTFNPTPCKLGVMKQEKSEQER